MAPILRAALALLTVALVGGDAVAGSGIEPSVVVASDQCKTIFTRYKQEVRPQFFVVSEDGSLCLFNYCQGGCRRGTQRQRALLRCERMSDQKCFVYAAYGQVIAPERLDLQ